MSLKMTRRRLFQLTGYKSFVRSDGYWWYRWHPNASIGFSQQWEKPIERYILHPGSCLVDVGSHVGRWTIRASSFYSRILAFEPDPFTNYVLRRNLARNHVRNVLAFAIALSDHGNESVLFDYGSPACNSLRTRHLSGAAPRGTMRVRVRSLDDFVGYFSSPMMLKIDVEGEELKVLQGAGSTLERYKPTLVIEVHFRNELPSILETIKKHGYIVVGLFPDPTNRRGQLYLVASTT